MIGDHYWTRGISLRPHGPYKNGFGWGVSLEYLDDGFCEGDSTEGELTMRYVVLDLKRAVDVLCEDATKLGIRFSDPTVFVEGDGEKDLPYPPNWREIARDLALSLGWEPAYK